jgi:uncharacterized protein YkwD
MRYRARLVLADVASPWSAEATIVVPGDAPPVIPPPPPPPTDGRPCPGDVAAQVLALVNDARAEAGVDPMRLQEQLIAAAAARATTLAAAGVLSHTGWIQAIQATGYANGTIGENIAYGYGSASGVFNAWMASDGHRANILAWYFADMGLACRLDAHGTWWWAQEFGG